MSIEERFRDLTDQAPNRRSLLKKLSLTSAALGAMATSPGARAQSTSAPSDLDILNFALNQEFLESEFYTVATTGKTIDTQGVVITGTGNAGATTGGAAVPFGSQDSVAKQVAADLAYDERTHVVLVQTAIKALGGQPIAKPAINLDAMGFGFASVGDFLKLARMFEELGMSAFAGAAPMLQDKTTLATTARIIGVEGQHLAALRLLIAQYGVATTSLDPADAVLPPPTGTFYFSVNSQALIEVRTPQQVLFVAYGMQANATSGGFFPNGANGTMTTSGTAATYDGASLTASPNPVPLAANSIDGVTTLTWNAPGSQAVEIHVNSPTGPVFGGGAASGSATTGQWVTDGMTFYLQDVSYGASASAANTIASVTVTAQRSSATTAAGA